ncbi:MAG TPA: glucosidase, partial [Segeticoccus sp.]|uniref:MGH1-like glycoside hydrolase domain-containing protein n=1 Tax=Segeticoccus sp. TaxID=2706531 RepID=UPI002D80EB5C
MTANAASTPTGPQDGQQTPEHRRLAEAPSDDDPWKLWGPYVSGRQWGTVREDYSADGDAWASFPFDHAHRRAYRWGEDGIAGICDRFGFLNLAVALWNGQDDRLKERYFGLTNAQGNHGEDAKEYWWALDATPTHSWAQSLYRYPQQRFPYAELVAENGRRGRGDEEFELSDTGVLADDRFFDVVTTHAKASPTDICVEVTATNRGPDPAPLDLVPQLWFRNTWSWGADDRRPSLRVVDAGEGAGAGARAGVAVQAEHGWLGRYLVTAEGDPRVLVCDNETNFKGLYGDTPPGASAHPKDAVDRAIVHGDESLLNPAAEGTKAAFWYHVDAVAPGESVTVRLRLRRRDGDEKGSSTPEFDTVLDRRRQEADAFYASVIPARPPEEDRQVARRAFAGLLWGKQLYRYDVRQWLEGDPAGPPPPPQRRAPEPRGRNTSWKHVALADVISMPDEWEYPWFATWDLAFHCVALAHVDPEFAKAQLVLLCREWAMHANGQLPAYEWNFSDVNPPVHAWAAWQVYCLDGRRDRSFLIRVFTKQLLNFEWWVNRKDEDGSDLFEGGFLGMDNIALFDRSEPLPGGERLEQSDATGWMGFFCLSMLRIALELARHEPAWDSAATKFLQHFLGIAEAMERFGSQGVSLWNDEDGFFYDALVQPGDGVRQLQVRSMVGLLPLLGVTVAPDWVPRELPDFTARLQWLRQHRPELTEALITTERSGHPEQTLALVDPARFPRVLARMLDEREFLSPHGIRSLSAVYRDGFSTRVDGSTLSLRYVPAESDTGLFGGNSNWRGPVWFP